jgi:hypothetical protein
VRALADPLESGQADYPGRVDFCGGRKDRTEPNVVDWLIKRFFRLSHRVGRIPNDLVGSQKSARGRGRKILLAKVNSRSAATQNKIAAIIDQDSDIMLRSKFDASPQVHEQAIDGGVLISNLDQPRPASHQLFQDR